MSGAGMQHAGVVCMLPSWASQELLLSQLLKGEGKALNRTASLNVFMNVYSQKYNNSCLNEE